eukprot:347602-Chlamydomonas_euryale.AAC.1
MSQAPCPRAVGTTVAVRNLFKALPVRHKVREGWGAARAWAVHRCCAQPLQGAARAPQGVSATTWPKAGDK